MPFIIRQPYDVFRSSVAVSKVGLYPKLNELSSQLFLGRVLESYCIFTVNTVGCFTLLRLLGVVGECSRAFSAQISPLGPYLLSVIYHIFNTILLTPRLFMINLINPPILFTLSLFPHHLGPGGGG